MSYQRDQALFDSFKVPHQVVAVVTDTVLARELASSFTNKCLFTIIMGQHNKINLRRSRKCTQLSISSQQKTISWLRISKLFCDDTLRSSFATLMSRDLITVVARSRFKIIYWLVYFFQKRFYIERMALLFSRFFKVDPKYLWFNGAKNCHIVNIYWSVRCYGNSTKRNWNVCCTHLLRLALRPIFFSA